MHRRALLFLSAALFATSATPALAGNSPLNDERAAAEVLTGNLDTASGSTTFATFDPISELPIYPGAAKRSVWFTYTPAADGLLTVDTKGSLFDTVLAVYRTDHVDLHEDRNDDISVGDSDSRVEVYVEAGTDYKIAVDGHDAGDYGSYTLHLALDTSPPQPANDDYAGATPIDDEWLAYDYPFAAIAGGFRHAHNGFATEEVGSEPAHRGYNTSHSLWYTWTAPKTGGVQVDACDSDFNPVVAAYTGASIFTAKPVPGTKGTGCGDGRIVFPAVQGTTYRIVVAATQGQAGLLELSLDQDSEAPNATLTMPEQTGPKPPVSYTGEGPGTCKVDNLPAFSCANGTKLGPLADGSHTLTFTAVDSYGNVDPTPSSDTFTVESTPPANAITGPPPALTNKTKVDIAFATDDKASYFCRTDYNQFAPCTSPYTTPAYTGGDHSFEVKGIDEHGNLSSVAKATWTVDTIKPGIAIGKRPDSGTYDASATIEFSSFDASATFRCTVDGAAPAPCSSPLTLGDVAVGDHKVLVEAVDPAGNASVPATVAWKRYAAKPQATVTPTATPVRTPTPTPTPTVNPHPRFRVLPVMSLTRSELTKKGVRFVVEHRGADSGRARLMYGRRTLGTASVSAKGPGPRTHTIKLTRAGRKAVAAAKKGRRLRLTLNVAVTESKTGAGAAGSTSVLVR